MTKTARVLVLAVFLVLQAAFPLGATAADGVPSEVVLSGYGGHVTARPGEHHAEVTFDGVGTTAFDNARVVVKRDRISITARSGDRSLYAWANRYGPSGGIGMVVRSRDRRHRPQTAGANVSSITIDGVNGAIRR